MHPQHLPPTNATTTISPHWNHSLINNPNDSGTCLREINMTSSRNYHKLDAATGTDDKGVDLNGKKKRVEQKPKTEEVEVKEKRENKEGARGNTEMEKMIIKNGVKYHGDG
ncbi:hypothetical protein RJT34_10248 [Clitoria ternatea]|uniref:Uncharacterized protein n=1 Tax=Clitoria ternatea TaxID=43366 RepID=A0AAN9K5W0_CLITE